MNETAPCPTCDGSGSTLMRGASMRGYDEPDFWDSCGICGGSGEVPASLFTDEPYDEEEDDSLAWSV